MEIRMGVVRPLPWILTKKIPDILFLVVTVAQSLMRETILLNNHEKMVL